MERERVREENGEREREGGLGRKEEKKMKKLQ